MQKINSEARLREAIVKLEYRRTQEEIILREQFHLTCENLKPINVIKSAFKEVVGSTEIKDNVVNTTVGLITGYVSKLLFVNVSHSPLRKLLGIALQFGVTKFVAKNPEAVKSMVNGLKNFISRKHEETAS